MFENLIFWLQNYQFICSKNPDPSFLYYFSFSSAAATILAISTWHARFRTSAVQPKIELALPNRGKSFLRPFQTGSFCFNTLLILHRDCKQSWAELTFDDEKIF